MDEEARRHLAAAMQTAEQEQASWRSLGMRLRTMAVDEVAPLLAEVLDAWSVEVLDGEVARCAHEEVLLARAQVLVAVGEIELLAESADRRADVAGLRWQELRRELVAA